MGRILDGDYDSWLQAYREWTLARSEAPESMIIWAGFFALSSALKRSVRFPKGMMGSYVIYPNLYIVYVAPPGVARKSTTMGFARDLLVEIEDVNIASTALSASKLIEILAKKTDGSLSITSGELGTFMNVSQEEMYDVLTHLYDNRSKYEYSTRMHGTEIVQNPTINFIGATTPEWVSEQMPQYVIGGGFASRTIFIYENKPRQLQLYYDIDADSYDVLEKALRHDLVHIMQIEGEFKHESDKVKRAMEEWYRNFSQKPPPSEKLDSYWTRRHVHLHKIAMLISIARSDELVITMKDFENARDVLKAVESNMPRVFSSVGRNPYSADIEKVRDYIHRLGAVPHKKIMSRFYHDIKPDALGEILSTLKIMGYVERHDEASEIVWKASGGSGDLSSL